MQRRLRIKDGEVSRGDGSGKDCRGWQGQGQERDRWGEAGRRGKVEPGQEGEGKIGRGRGGGGKMREGTGRVISRGMRALSPHSPL